MRYNEISKEEFLQDVKIVIETTGETRKSTYEKYGKFSSQNANNKFGSWKNTLEAIGEVSHHRHGISKEEAIKNAVYVFNKCGKFTKQANKIHGSISDAVYIRLFGSWNNALREMNLKINSDRGIARELIIEDMLRVHSQTGRLTRDIYQSKGKYGVNTVKRIVAEDGTWNSALSVAGLNINCHINIPEQKLLDELKRLYQEYGCLSSAIIKNGGAYSVEVYQRRFGSINNAFRKIGADVNEYGFSVVANATINTFESILGEKAEREKQFDWLVNPKTGRKLFVDAYFPKNNIAVEYNGEQHYSSRSFNRSKEVFEEGVLRDLIKKELLKQNNIELIVVKYDESIDKEYLASKLCV